MKSVTASISASFKNAPWRRIGLSAALYNMSPRPNNCSAPIPSKMVVESVNDDTLKAILVGMFALIVPLTTSVVGLWVATNK